MLTGSVVRVRVNKQYVLRRVVCTGLARDPRAPPSSPLEVCVCVDGMTTYLPFFRRVSSEQPTPQEVSEWVSVSEPACDLTVVVRASLCDTGVVAGSDALLAHINDPVLRARTADWLYTL